jgi:hypothetical protein
MLKFRHIRNRNDYTKKTFHVVTICTNKIDDQTIAYSLAFCSKGDHFNKAVGREIAQERIRNSTDTVKISTTPIHLTIINDILSKPDFEPFWVKEFLRKYIRDTKVRVNK